MIMIIECDKMIIVYARDNNQDDIAMATTRTQAPPSKKKEKEAVLETVPGGVSRTNGLVRTQKLVPILRRPLLSR